MADQNTQKTRLSHLENLEDQSGRSFPLEIKKTRVGDPLKDQVRSFSFDDQED